MKRRRNFNDTVGIITTLLCTLTTTTLALDENINYNSADENELIVKVKEEGVLDIANPAIGEDYVLLNNYNNVENEPQPSEIVSGGSGGEGHQSANEEEEEGPSSPNNNYSDEEDYYTSNDIEQYDEFNYETYDHYASTSTYETYFDERDSPEFQQLLTADTTSGGGDYYHETKLDLEELSNEDMDSILNEIEVGRTLRAVHRELEELGLVNNDNYEEDEEGFEFEEAARGIEGGFSPRRRKEQSDIAKLTLDEHVNMILNQRYQERLLLDDKATADDQAAVKEEEEGGGAFEAGVQSKPVVLKGTNSIEDDRGLRKKTMMKKGLGGNRGPYRPNGAKRFQNGRFKKGNNKNPYLKNGYGNEGVTGQGNRQFRNVCLDPPDRYRTCISRTINPKNDVEDCNHIERNGYNFAAQLHKRDRPIPSYLPPLYTPPFIASRVIEERTPGNMHLTIFQAAKDLTCDDLIDLEEATLKYLAEYTGDSETFMPACAYIDRSDFDEQITRNSDGEYVKVTALLVEVTYIMKKDFNAKITQQYSAELRKKQEALDAAQGGRKGGKGGGGLRNRKLQQFQRPEMCDSANQALCCGQKSINADVGGFCRTLGCDFNNCGARGLGQRPPGRPDQPEGGRPERPPSRPGALPSRPGTADTGGGGVPPGGNDDAAAIGIQPSRPQRPPRPQRPGQGQGQGGGRPGQGNRPGQGGGGRPNRPPRPGASRQLSLERALQQESICRQPALEDKAFTRVIRQQTALSTSQLARSLLNDTDIKLVAQCSSNWYNVNQQQGIPTVTCDQFEETLCQEHQDLEFDENDVECLEPSAAPSSAPSFQPSDAPSISTMPSVSTMPSYPPTLYPTLEPTLSPSDEK